MTWRMEVVVVVLVATLLTMWHGVGADCPTVIAPRDRRVNKTQLTITAYNVEWLFLNGRNCPGSGCRWANEQEAENHLNQVAKELAIIDADIVLLIEVQSCEVLDRLLQKLEQRRLGYKFYLLQGTDTITGQNVALLTRVDPAVSLARSSARSDFPLAGSKCEYTGSPGSQGVSKHLYTHFDIEGLPRPLLLVGLHFLAFPKQSDRCAQREAQAWVIQDIVKKQLLERDYSVVVLGDMNDFDPTIVDTAGSVPNSRVLTMLKQYGSTSLVNVAKYISSQSERYSNWFDMNKDCKVTPNELSLIDHVLLSKDLEPLIEKAYIDHSYPAACGYDSDHWPVLVKLRTTDSSDSVTPEDDSYFATITIVLSVSIVVCVVLIAVVAVAAVLVWKRNRVYSTWLRFISETRI